MISALVIEKKKSEGYQKIHRAPARIGVWRLIARRHERRRPLAEALVSELASGLALIKRVPPDVTYFGGACIKRSDPHYATAEEWRGFARGPSWPEASLSVQENMSSARGLTGWICARHKEYRNAAGPI
jgi:hypothetical protein